MSRLASKTKGGFYPLPPVVTPLILSHLAAPHGGRLLDPCAGDGVPLMAFARALHLEAYGVELHTERARQAGAEVQTLAGRRLPFQDQPQRRLLAGDYRTLGTVPGSFNLLYCNPPYDQDHEAGRLEYQWLRDTRPYLQPGGVLVLVIPQHVLGFPRLARYLVSWFDQCLIGRFPDPAYAAFGQVVVFGVRRAEVCPPDPTQVEHCRTLAQAGHTLAVLPQAAQSTYILPAPQVPPARFFFRSTHVSLEEALAEARVQGVRALPAWQQQLAPPATAHTPVAPLMPLKVGHLAGLIAAGFLDRQVLEDGPTRLLIRGRAYKQLTHRTHIEELPDGAQQQVTTATETIVTDVTTLATSGEVSSLRGADLERFLARWMASLTAQVARRYPPRYAFDYQGGPDAPILDQLSLARPIPIMGGYGLLPAQKHAAAALATRLRTHADALLVGQTGTGKAQPLDARVLTPTGWTRMADICVGDAVINPAGGTARVVGVFPQGEKEIYRVTFNDGGSTECCDDHLWQVFTTFQKWYGSPPKVLALSQFRHRLHKKNGARRYFIPLVTPVDFEEHPLPLDPYLLGVLLGDGGLSQGSISLSSGDAEILEAVAETLPEGIKLRYQAGYDYRLSSGSRAKANPVTQAIRALGLHGCRSETKFIPDCYLHASLASRLALLQGLMDTDGSVSSGYDLEYPSTSYRLALGVQELVRSLGGTARIRSRYPTYTYKGQKQQGRLCYRMSVVLPAHIRPFRLSRKADAYQPGTKYGPSRSIKEVVYVGRKEAQCIALDSENQLYVTDDYIVTHNTTVGVATAALLESRRTLVLAPPHLVHKWVREAELVWPEVEATILTTVSEVQAWFARSTEHPQMAVLSYSRAKLASGWHHAYDGWEPSPSRALVRAGDHPTPNRPKRAALLRYRQRRGVRCPDCGTPVCDDEGLPLFPADLEAKRGRLSCMACGTPLYQFDRRRRADQVAGSFRTYIEREAQIRQTLAAGTPGQAAVLPTFPAPAGYARWPLARYIRQHYRSQVDLLLVDELHELKGDTTDQGLAFQDLAVASRKVLGLTGTIFGGKCSSLFHLLYRLAPEFRAAFTDTTAQGRRRLQSTRWGELYGVHQEIETARLDPESGKLTANRRSSVRVRELPGASPALLPWLLNRSVFLSLNDLGYALPRYEEIPVVVEMSPALAAGYQALYGRLRSLLSERLVRQDKSLLGAYLQALLCWVDAPWRAEVIRDPHATRRGESPEASVLFRQAGLDANTLYPKEAAVLQLLAQEKAAGRRSVLYVQQTDTRDITPRWLDLLSRAGLKAAVLKVAPEKREAWLAQQVAAGVDVILTHPRRVATGLDLVRRARA